MANEVSFWNYIYRFGNNHYGNLKRIAILDRNFLQVAAQS